MPHEKIPVIEDEDKISGIVKSYLEREGFVITLADTGQKALQRIKGDHDLIILKRRN